LNASYAAWKFLSAREYHSRAAASSNRKLRARPATQKLHLSTSELEYTKRHS
jgi:hypothetical protein